MKSIFKPKDRPFHKWVMYGNFETKEVQVQKCLGQYLSAAGLSDSVVQTVAARVGKVNLVVNDWRAQAVGGMVSALLLREAYSVPSLLHRAGTWAEISSETEKELNYPQLCLCR